MGGFPPSPLSVIETSIRGGIIPLFLIDSHRFKTGESGYTKMDTEDLLQGLMELESELSEDALNTAKSGANQPRTKITIGITIDLGLDGATKFEELRELQNVGRRERGFNDITQRDFALYIAKQLGMDEISFKTVGKLDRGLRAVTSLDQVESLVQTYINDLIIAEESDAEDEDTEEE